MMLLLLTIHRLMLSLDGLFFHEAPPKKTLANGHLFCQLLGIPAIRHMLTPSLALVGELSRRPRR